MLLWNIKRQSEINTFGSKKHYTKNNFTNKQLIFTLKIIPMYIIICIKPFQAPMLAILLGTALRYNLIYLYASTLNSIELLINTSKGPRGNVPLKNMRNPNCNTKNDV